MLREMTNVVPHQHSSVTTGHQMSEKRQRKSNREREKEQNPVNGRIHISIKRKIHTAHILFMRHFASNT